MNKWKEGYDGLGWNVDRSQYMNLRMNRCIYFALLFCIHGPINIKTAKSIGPKFCVGHDPREGLWMVKILKISLQQNLIFIQFWKSTIFFYKIRELFCYFYTCSQLKSKMDRPESLVIIISRWTDEIMS